MAATPAPGTGLAPQAFGGTSLDTFIQSIQDLTGAQGQSTLQSGTATTNAGVNALAPSLDLLTKLTKGDQGDVTQAAQPEIDQITQQFDAIRNMISLQPRGGGKTSALAEAPFQKSAAVQRTEGDMRTKAAGELGSLGTNLAGIGLSQEGVGEGLEALSSNTALTKQGLNYGQPSTLDQIVGTASAATNIITALL